MAVLRLELGGRADPGDRDRAGHGQDRRVLARALRRRPGARPTPSTPTSRIRSSPRTSPRRSCTRSSCRRTSTSTSSRSSPSRRRRCARSRGARSQPTALAGASSTSRQQLGLDVGERQLRHEEQQRHRRRAPRRRRPPTPSCSRRAARRVEPTSRDPRSTSTTPKIADANEPPIVLVVLVRPAAMPGLARAARPRRPPRAARATSAPEPMPAITMFAKTCQVSRWNGRNSR